MKDPFERLIDEIIPIRNDVKNLQRTSLDREEVEALNEMIVGSADRMGALIMDAARAVSDDAKQNRDQIACDTKQTATRAAERAVTGLREHPERPNAHHSVQ